MREQTLYSNLAVSGIIKATDGFGEALGDNSFGLFSNTNEFGLAAFNLNSFGNQAAVNYFGIDCNNNYFGTSSMEIQNINDFGSEAATNKFGTSTTGNTYGGGVFESGIRLRLNQFSGSKSQLGQIGELKVSGSGLYICTGTNSWGRTFISSF